MTLDRASSDESVNTSAMVLAREHDVERYAASVCPWPQGDCAEPFRAKVRPNRQLRFGFRSVQIHCQHTPRDGPRRVGSFLGECPVCLDLVQRDLATALPCRVQKASIRRDRE